MFRRWLSAIAVTLVVVTPAVGLWWVRERTTDHLSVVAPVPGPVTFTVKERVDDRHQAATLLVTWGEPQSVLSPPWAGTVTGVPVVPGDIVEVYDPVVEIDGVLRIAVGFERPFYRSLSRRSRGSDVVQLQTMLSEFGFYNGAFDGEVGSSTELAIDDFAASLGAGDADGVFDPAWTVWIGDMAPFDVASVSPVVGAVAPVAGSSLLVGPTPVREVVFVDSSDELLPLPGRWLFTFQGVEFEVVDGAPTPDAVAAIEATVAAGTERITGMVALAEPVVAIDVPPSAIVTGADGTMCVWVVKGSAVEPAQVVLAESAIGAAVSNGLTPGETILTNPVDLNYTSCS